MNIPIPPDSSSKSITILAGSYFDSYTREFVKDQLITVCPERGIITDIRPISPKEEPLLLEQDRDNMVDLREQTVLPGFVDTHVHFFLHPYSETSWEDQVTRESIIERTVRAVTHAKKTLLAGFTTVRDLGTEGAGDADISLRKCLSGPNPMIPGPRYFCANRALVTTGSYGPKGVHHMNTDGVEGITGAEVVDGKDECRRAVRRQVGAGADWIKIYADYSARSRISDVSARAASKSIPTFHWEELHEIISTANSLGVKTAVHLHENDSASRLLFDGAGKRLIPHSLEHGFAISEMNFEQMRDRGIYWVPTLSAYYSHRPVGTGSQRWDQAKSTFQRALKMEGIKIACGGDTGVFAHGENALELKLMVQLGADWKQVLQWATLGGWECVRGMQWEGKEGQARIEMTESLKEDARVAGDNDMPFGVIRKGFAADIIAIKGDPSKDFEKAVDADSISFVMKGGRIFKRDGREVS